MKIIKTKSIPFRFDHSVESLDLKLNYLYFKIELIIILSKLNLESNILYKEMEMDEIRANPQTYTTVIQTMTIISSLHN